MEQFSFILTGFGVVMSVLAFLWASCAIIGFAFTARDRRPKPAPKAAPEAAPAPSIAPGIPPAHVAAISAAVAAMSSRYRLVRVDAPAHVAHAWAGEGRFEHFSAHRTRFDWEIRGPKRGRDGPAS
ncbi:MAG: OadG family transporter subunit [Magnetospiraceae bacterium]